MDDYGREEGLVSPHHQAHQAKGTTAVVGQPSYTLHPQPLHAQMQPQQVHLQSQQIQLQPQHLHGQPHHLQPQQMQSQLHPQPATTMMAPHPGVAGQQQHQYIVQQLDSKAPATFQPHQSHQPHQPHQPQQEFIVQANGSAALTQPPPAPPQAPQMLQATPQLLQMLLSQQLQQNQWLGAGQQLATAAAASGSYPQPFPNQPQFLSQQPQQHHPPAPLQQEYVQMQDTTTINNNNANNNHHAANNNNGTTTNNNNMHLSLPSHAASHSLVPGPPPQFNNHQLSPGAGVTKTMANSTTPFSSMDPGGAGGMPGSGQGAARVAVKRSHSMTVEPSSNNNHSVNNGQPAVPVSSRFHGVTWYKASRRWQARLCTGRKQYHLGYFRDEEEAARAYDRAVLQHAGPRNAQLNFPEEAAAPAPSQAMAGAPAPMSHEYASSAPPTPGHPPNKSLAGSALPLAIRPPLPLRTATPLQAGAAQPGDDNQLVAWGSNGSGQPQQPSSATSQRQQSLGEGGSAGDSQQGGAPQEMLAPRKNPSFRSAHNTQLPDGPNPSSQAGPSGGTGSAGSRGVPSQTALGLVSAPPVQHASMQTDPQPTTSHLGADRLGLGLKPVGALPSTPGTASHALQHALNVALGPHGCMSPSAQQAGGGAGAGPARGRLETAAGRAAVPGVLLPDTGEFIATGSMGTLQIYEHVWDGSQLVLKNVVVAVTSSPPHRQQVKQHHQQLGATTTSPPRHQQHQLEPPPPPQPLQLSASPSPPRSASPAPVALPQQVPPLIAALHQHEGGREEQQQEQEQPLIKQSTP